MNDSEQIKTVSLDDLKQAIAVVIKLKNESDFIGHDGGVLHAIDILEAQSNALRAAFEWHVGVCQRKWEAGVTIRNSGNNVPWIAVTKEMDEGMTLIRETLS